MAKPDRNSRRNDLREKKKSTPFFYCRFVTNYPKTAFALTLSGHLLIVAATVTLILLGYDLFPTNFDSLPMHDWNVPWRRRDWAWTHRDNYTGRYVRKLDQQNLPNWFRAKEYARGNIVLYYDAEDKNIFTPNNLYRMEQIEKSIVSMEQYSHYCVQILPMICMKPASVLRYFDGTFASVSPVFYDPNFSNIAAVIHEASTNNETKEDFAIFMAKYGSSSPEFVHASVTRTIIPLGYPLNNDKDIRRMEKTMQMFLVDSFKPLIMKLKSETPQFDLVYWSYLLFKSDLAEQALKDAILAIGSFLFIFSFIVYHTKSLWISTFAVMSIFTSFLAANLIYRILLDFRYIGFFHIIAIFIILGIGADDLFIFLDVWKNSAYRSYPSLAHRLSDSFRRAVISMLVTSLTTVIAFFASAFSPLLPAKSFGVFAGLLVIVNYFSVVIFFPSVVIMHHIYFKNCGWPCFRCCKSGVYCVDKGKVNTKTTSRTIDAYNDSTTGSYSTWTTDGGENNSSEHEREVRSVSAASCTDSFDTISEREAVESVQEVVDTDSASDPEDNDELDAGTAKKKFLVRFFRDYFFKFVTHKVCRWIIVIFLMTVAVFFTYSAVHLELDSEQTKFYRKSHNYGKAIEFDSYAFKKNFADRDVVVYIAWGLQHRDMSACHFSDELCSGVQRFDESFNPNSKEAQLALLNFCATLHSFSAKEIHEFRIRRSEHTNQPEIKCFMADLQQFLENIPTTTNESWSIPWDNNKTKSFMESKPLIYDTSRIDKDFSNLLEIPISYWLNDGYRFQNKQAFIDYSPLIGEGLSQYSTPLMIDFSVFVGNKIKYLGVEVNLTLGRFSTGYSSGKPIMDRWEKFVSSEMRKMPPGLKNGFQLTKTFWHSLSVQKTMADSAIFGIALGIGCAFPILTIATKNIITAFFATMSLCCSTACVIGVIPLAGWKLGLIESLNMCMVVGLSVDYVVHLAEGYYMSAHTDRLSRIRDMLEEVGISVFSGACTTLGASVFMLFAQILFIIKFGIFMFCTIGFSLIFALGFFTTIMGLVGPSGKAGDISVLYQRLYCWKGKKETAAKKIERNFYDTHF